MTGRKTLLIRILSVALMVIAGSYIYNLLADDWGKFVRSVSEVNPVLFGISVVLGVVANLVAAYFYVFLLKGHHDIRSWRPPLKIFLYSQIVRYVPGKVWSYLYQISLLPAEFSKTTTILTNLEMVAISMVVIGGAGLAAILWPSFLYIFVFVFCLSVGIAISYRVGLVDWILNRLLRPLMRFGVNDLKRRPYKVAAMASVITGWVMLVFTSSIVVLHSIWPLSTDESITYAACLLLSWILSALVFIVPMGIGVRETGFVALSALVIGTLDGGQLAATAIIVRFWQLIVDILSGFCSFLISGDTERSES